MCGEEQISLFIEGKFPSCNEYIDASRKNRYLGASMKRKVNDLMAAQIRNSVLKRVERPCTIRFEWYELTKRRDIDNVAFAKKFVLDALQDADILPNDNYKWVTGFSDEFIYGEKQGVRITICESG